MRKTSIDGLIKRLLTGFILVALPLGLWAASVNFHKKDLPRSIRIEETGDILSLRGVSVHKNFLQDSYVGAFYSLSPLSDPKQALADGATKRMWMYVLKPIPDFRQHMRDALQDNNSPKIIDQEQIYISQFLTMMDVSLKAGDVVVFDYLPKLGTKIMINGSVRGIIKGNEFYTYVLRTWMGRQPPSQKFRQDLFNLSS